MSYENVHGHIPLGAVSFLNSRPLLYGLVRDPRISLQVGVPSSLAARLQNDEFAAALVPIVDVLRSNGTFGVVSDGCIACDGETMTVRVFSQVPPDRITRIVGDPDSHTSVVLARVLWRALYDRDIEIVSPSGAASDLHVRRSDETGIETPWHAEKCSGGPAYDSDDAVLLIGDKVVDPHRAGYAYEIDLGGAWRAHTGLPFVFAVWAAKTDSTIRGNKGSRIQGFEDSSIPKPDDSSEIEPANSHWENEAPAEPSREDLKGLRAILDGARDAGVAAAASIARKEGPAHGWPVELAERYLTRCLQYKLTPRMIEGANLFARLAGELGLCPRDAEIDWQNASTIEPSATPG
ncbi:MAG: menaquinone biosynthetic enzyme MqnA/MqnD family protein [Phycisphaerae bacterium]